MPRPRRHPRASARLLGPPALSWRRKPCAWPQPGQASAPPSGGSGFPAGAAAQPDLIAPHLSRAAARFLSRRPVIVREQPAGARARSFVPLGRFTFKKNGAEKPDGKRDAVHCPYFFRSTLIKSAHTLPSWVA